MSKPTYTRDALHITQSIDALFARKDEITIRFSVQMDIERPMHSEGDGCWVNISGESSNVAEAKVIR